MMRLLSLFFLVVFLSACGASRPAVERQSFLLQAERAGAAREPVAGTLAIGRVDVAPPFDERGLVYRRDDVRYETDFYNQFAADPGEMLGEATAGWLRQSGLFRQVLAPGAASRFDLRLDADVSAFYVDFQAGVPAAVLDIRWQLVRESDGSAVLGMDTRQRVPLEERSPAGAVRAYREALRQALVRLETALAEAGL